MTHLNVWVSRNKVSFFGWSKRRANVLEFVMQNNRNSKFSKICVVCYTYVQTTIKLKIIQSLFAQWSIIPYRTTDHEREFI